MKLKVLLVLAAILLLSDVYGQRKEEKSNPDTRPAKSHPRIQFAGNRPGGHLSGQVPFEGAEAEG